jgi:RND family efflux transporter MFP subunit
MSSPPSKRRRRWPWIAGAFVVGAAIAGWWWFGNGPSQQAQAKRGPAPVAVVTARVEARDVPVKLVANGTVTALQSVELRSQITSTVREVHIREGQTVQKGDLLFSLDAGAQNAELKKAQAQVEKDRADLATAMRDLERQRELFRTKFISQAALDQAQNRVDTLNGQLAVNSAAVEATRVQRAYTEIRAPFSGRTGAIAVRSGSLVQPNGAVLVTIAQIDPVSVTFTLPERELPGVQKAMASGNVDVTAAAGGERHSGRLSFVDNSVDTTTGTIRVKAEFPNRDARLWPGMYVNVEMSPRMIANAAVVPAQAVQTGPEERFVYVVGEDRKVASRPVKLAYVEQGFAVVEGVAAGTRVVVEGAQNLRPGSVVTEATTDRSPPGAPADAGEGPGPKSKGKGKKKAEEKSG